MGSTVDSNDYLSDSSDFEELKEEPGGDINAMGFTGSSYTAADHRVMAKYIAGFDDWWSLTRREQWSAFCLQVTQPCLSLSFFWLMFRASFLNEGERRGTRNFVETRKVS